MYYLIVWLLCGYVGWFMTIQDISRHKVPTAYDAVMIGPCMAGGPIQLALSTYLRFRYLRT